MIFNKYKHLLAENERLKAEIESKNKQSNSLLKENAQLKTEREELLKSRQEENSLKKQNNVFKEKIVSDAEKQAEEIVSDAENKAKKIQEEALLKYKSEISRLSDFIARWQANLPEIKDKSANARKRRALCLLLSEILTDEPKLQTIEDGINLVEKLDRATGGKESAGENTGFSLDEVLNPSEDLDLELLCKELGVME